MSVAGLLIPEAIAYAGIAGLASEHALIASVAGLIAYACVGRSRGAIVTPTSSSAAVLAAGVATLTASAPAGTDALMLSGALVLLTGLLFVVGAAARVGHLAAFVSRPVLRGFAFGLAITIVSKQLPYIAGITLPAESPIPLLLSLAQRIADWNPWPIAIGCAAYAGLRLLKRIPWFPGAFLVTCAGVAAASFFDMPAHGVALVGRIDFGDPTLALPALGRDDWLRAGELAFPLVVILYAESWGSIRTLALRHGDDVDPNRELAALGAANLLSALLQGLPVGAGFSASSANEDAGARGRTAGLVAALTITVLVLAAGPWLARLPQPVLAAVVISALTHALDPRPMLALWRLGRDEFLATAAVLAVVVLGVLHGMLLSVLLSVLAAVRRFSRARVSVLGELGQTRDYVDASRNSEARTTSEVLVLRPEQPLFFANAEQALGQVRALAQRHADASFVVLSLEESTDLDSTALEAITELQSWMAGAHRRLILARVKEDVRQLLARIPAAGAAIPCYWSVADAVNAARAGAAPNA